jgi:hypothetical protein
VSEVPFQGAGKDFEKPSLAPERKAGIPLEPEKKYGR